MMEKSRARALLVAFPVALMVMVISSVLLVRSLAVAEPETKYLVTAQQAEAYGLPNGAGAVQLLLGPHSGANEASMNLLVVKPGAGAPTHTHENSAELVYLIEGRVTVVIAGKQYPAGPGDAIYIPVGVEHSFSVNGVLLPARALQVYVGAGPEQKFRQGKRVIIE